MLVTCIQRYDKKSLFFVQFKNERLTEILQSFRCHFSARLNNVHGELLYYPALASALALASASTNVKVFVKVFKTSLFPNLTTDLIYLWYDDPYWSTILCSTIPITLGHVKVKVTDLEFLC